MPVIAIETKIAATQKVVFDLSRSIDLHIISTQQTGEKTIAGRTSGLIELNETVTWQARHFGIIQKLTTKITEMNSPHYFVDEMTKGVFKEMVHRHSFSENDGFTLMTDHFNFTSPLGIFGRLADAIFLKSYMTSLLRKRNQTIRKVAESNDWKEILS